MFVELVGALFLLAVLGVMRKIVHRAEGSVRQSSLHDSRE